MISRSVVGIALLLTLLLFGETSPALSRSVKIGAWDVEAFMDENTGNLSHCTGSATYKSGITTGFSISRNLNWAMVFFNPAWKLSKGSVYDIAFTVDDMTPILAKAQALGKSGVVVRLHDSSELFSRFRRGFVLSVATSENVFQFNLTGTSQLLPFLLRCAMQNGDLEVASNPFGKTKPVVEKTEPVSVASDRAAMRAEATTLAANLLSQAGVQGFALLDPTDVPTVKADAKWMAGDVFGTITVVPEVPASQLSEVPSVLIGKDAKSCKGTFLSGAIQDEPKAALARVFTSCSQGNNTTTVYYLAVPRKAGGAYIITTASTGSEKPAKEADSNIRNAAYRVLAVN